MAKSIRKSLKEYESRKNVAGDKCSQCKQPFDTHPDEPQKKIDEKVVCEDCYYEVLGDFIEKNPIHTPGRRGIGGTSEL